MQSIRACVETTEKTETFSYKHFFNALKYCSSILVIALSILGRKDHSLRPYWVVASCFSSAYALFWDIHMDWGLGTESLRLYLHGESGDSGAPMLRVKRMYPNWAYYAAITYNSIARCGWAILVSPYQPIVAAHVVLLLGCVELLRRAIWACLRLEWEHIQRGF